MINIPNLSEFQDKINYHFKNDTLLRTALTHSSFRNEYSSPIDYNERLEFLGDSVLGLISADYFFHLSHLSEGEMTKKRAACVCENGLYQFAKEINLGDMILLGRGEARGGGRNKKSILSDAFEALIAAIYLDGGLDCARDFVLPFLKNFDEKSVDISDYKSKIQEIVQKNPNEHLTYILASESGPDHNKEFEVELYINSNLISSGKGSSKRNAEQNAAKAALNYFGIDV